MPGLSPRDPDFGIEIHRLDEAPCPRCGCPFIYEKVRFRSMDRSHAWRDQDGEWYCGPRRELVEIGCLAVACDWTTIGRFRDGKRINESDEISFEEGARGGFEA